MTTLILAFTVPKTPDECIALGVSPMHVDSAIVYRADIDDLCAYDVDDMGEWNTEIPVSRFLDLLHDRITPWRLEELGFVHSVRGIYELNVNPHGHFTLEYCEGFVYVSAGRTSITTFTELLTLIRMLTPNTNKP